MGDVIGLITFIASMVLVLGFIALPLIDTSGDKGVGNRYRAPPPPWHAQHKKGCPARSGYDRQAKPRVKVCGCCGKQIKHPTPNPPRKTARTGPL